MPVAPFQTYSLSRLDPVYSPDKAREISVNLAPSTTYAKGQVLAELTATPGTYGVYVAGGAGGLGTPKAILRYACTTDAAGNITSTGDLGVTEKNLDVFYCGAFRIEEVVGLDAAGLTAMGGHVMQGVLGGTGVFIF